jgi:2-polyprenyl-3-methyl-5-hydroxy-6-metoxy-1,4-benzoquinol methylase
MEEKSKVTSADLVAFLKRTTVNAGIMDALKIHYRPFICPFDDLLNELRAEGPVRVFDVGCGSGQFALLVAQFSLAVRITGIEIDERLISNARQLFASHQYRAETSFRKYDGDQLPDDINEHDIVFLIDVLHHVPKRLQKIFLAQLYARMRPGAKLIIKDIDGNSPFVLFNKMHDLIFAREIGNEWPATNLAETCKTIGFTVDSLTRKRLYVYPHFTLALRK